MVEIIAIVRPNKTAETKQALLDIGKPGIHMRESQRQRKTGSGTDLYGRFGHYNRIKQ